MVGEGGGDVLKEKNKWWELPILNGHNDAGLLFHVARNKSNCLRRQAQQGDLLRLCGVNVTLLGCSGFLNVIPQWQIGSQHSWIAPTYARALVCVHMHIRRHE